MRSKRYSVTLDGETAAAVEDVADTLAIPVSTLLGLILRMGIAASNGVEQQAAAAVADLVAAVQKRGGLT